MPAASPSWSTCTAARSHDAGRAGHHRPRPPRPPRRLGRRDQHRRRRRHPHPGPRRFYREVVDFDLPAGRRLRHRHRLPPRRRRRGGRRPSRPSTRSWPARASRSSAGATCPSTPTRLGSGRPRRHADVPPAVPGRARRRARRPRPRAPGLRGPQAHRARGRRRGDDRGLLPEPLVPHHRLQGHAHHAAAARLLPRPADERVESAIALVHSRFSTNTFPSWPLAHPYRYLAHNGEINTVKGNRNWMRAREALLASDLFPGDIDRIFPICTPGASDTASFDEVLELLHLGGRPLPPRRADDDPRGVGEPRPHGSGQAGLLPVPLLADGAVGRPGQRRLHRRHRDRRRARPQRPAPRPLLGHHRRPGRPRLRGRRARHRPPTRSSARAASSPGRCSWSTPPQGRIIDDDEIKADLAAEHPYQEWLDAGHRRARRPARPARTSATRTATSSAASSPSATRSRTRRSSSRRWPAPAARPSARWAPTRPSPCCPSGPGCCSTTSPSCFAQVTNPPLDAIREELVTSLGGTIGPEQNLLDPDRRAPAARSSCPFPILDNDQLAKLIHVDDDADSPTSRPSSSTGLYPVAGGGEALRAALDDVRRQVSEAIADGANIVVLVGPRLHAASWRRSRRCCSPRPCTTTWCGRRPAPRSAWSSRPATPARCTTWRCSSGTAPPPSTRTWPSRPSRT